MIRTSVLVLFCFLFCSCSTISVKKENKPVLNSNDIPIKPEFDISFLERLDCKNIETISMLTCLYPEIDIPFPYCEREDYYAVLGIIPFAICTKDADIIVSQIKYEKSSYKASTIGLMQRTIYKIKNEKKRKFTRPMIWTKNLKEKDAYTMMMSAYIEFINDGVFTSAMKNMISDYASRETDCLFFQYLRDLTNNDFSNSFKLASQSKSNCSYYKNFDKNTVNVDIQYVQDLVRKKL
jgi:hypothetical protein